MRERGAGRAEGEGGAGPEARPLAQGEGALEGEKSEERRERVAASLDAVLDSEREERVERGRGEPGLRPAEPSADVDEEREVEERSREGEEPHDDVAAARRRERKEEDVRHEVVERRAGIDAQRREDLQHALPRDGQREDLVGPERPDECDPEARCGAGREGKTEKRALAPHGRMRTATASAERGVISPERLAPGAEGQNPFAVRSAAKSASLAA